MAFFVSLIADYIEIKGIEKYLGDLFAILFPGPSDMEKKEICMVFETKYLCGCFFK